MIPEQALRLAGDNARLVARPAGRLHVYAGPLTPSGRYVPRSARTVCRTRTRRLQVVEPHWVSSLDLEATRSGWSVCGSCSARLLPRGRAEQHRDPVDRTGFRAQYGDVTKADLAIALELATTPAEVAAAAHLSLVLFDVAGTMQPFLERGRRWSALHQMVVDARTRVGGYPESWYAERDRQSALSVMARAQGAAERKEARAEDEARVARLGINNVRPNPRRRRAPRGA